MKKLSLSALALVALWTSAAYAQKSATEFDAVKARGLSFSPVQEWGGGGAENLPTLELNNWAPVGIQTNSVIVVRGADNEGTRITGIDTTGINVGDVRYFINLPTGASVPTDSGSLTFIHESPLSLAANRIQTPGKLDCSYPVYGVAELIYGGKDMDGNHRWRIRGDCGWTGVGRMAGQMLGLYPNCPIGMPTPISGTFNNWRPTCFTNFTSGYWIAGATTDSWEYSVFNVFTDAGGATITGLYHNTTQTDNRSHGPVKFIRNLGPGPLTLKHLDAGSDVNNRFVLPRERDIVLQKNESAIVYSAFNDGVGLSAQWYVLSTGQSNELFPTATVAGTTELQGALELSGITTPAALSSGTTNNYDPGSRNAVWRLTPNAANSTLSGIAAPALGDKEIHLVENVGSGNLIFTHLDGGSAGSNQFQLPRGSSLYLPAGGGAVIRYDETALKWFVIGHTRPANDVTHTPGAAPVVGCIPTYTDGNGTLSSTCSSSDNGSTLTLGASRLVTIAGSTTFSQLFAAPGGIVDQHYWANRLVPAAITSGSSTNDWNPTSLHTKTWIVVSTSTSSLATLTGMNFGGTGEIKVLCNFGPGPVKIMNASASSGASSRFALAEGIDTTMPDNATGRMPCIGFRYDNGNTQWEEMWRTFEGANPGLPVLSSCGTSPALSTNCTNTHCTVTTGTGATACTVTFGNGGYTNEPTCTVTPRDGTARAYTVTTTALTLAAASASAKYDVICGGG